MTLEVARRASIQHAASAVTRRGIRIVSGLMFAGFGACSSVGTPVATNGDVHREECYLSGLATRNYCVSLSVPLDWERPEGPRITIAAAVVPATGHAEPDPLFVLPGGPGQGATTYGALVSTAFADVRRSRDIVLIDPRGTGRSTPFPCLLQDRTDRSPTSVERREMGGRCAAQAPADAAFFTAREVVADIDSLRRALGYSRVNLWGGSFGTRLAQFYVAAHGDAVRSATFDAAVPARQRLIVTAPADAESALVNLYARCHADKRCAARYGDGVRQVRATIRAFDRPATLMLPDPATGALMPRHIGAADVAEAIRGALYVPSSASMVPFAVDRLSHGDGAPLAALVAEAAGWSTSTQQMGALLGIICSEEAAFVTAADLARATLAPTFGMGYSRVFLDYCRDWPVRPVPMDKWTLRDSPVPALVLSGAADPASPPWRGEQLRSGFAFSHHVVVQNGGHINSARGCVPRLLAAFLTAPRRSLDSKCVHRISAPPFALAAAGPIGDTR